MFTKYRLTPIVGPDRDRCPVSHQAVYSLAGIHPQCAIERAISLESKSRKQALSKAGGSAAVAALATDVAFKREARRVIIVSR
jgi:hypothetical protein